MNECARMNCDKPAVAMLTFAPAQAKAWLYDMETADPTSGIMLCRKHANATVVPMSWQLIDGRDPAWPGPAPDRVDAENAPVEPVSATPQTTSVTSVTSVSSGSSIPSVLPVEVRQPVGAALQAGRREIFHTAGLLSDSSSNPEPHQDADMSLFQLPLSDMPAVSPHPDYR